MDSTQFFMLQYLQYSKANIQGSKGYNISEVFLIAKRFFSIEKDLFNSEESHVGKYDRADDRPKLAMLAANVGYRYWTDDRSRLG